VSLHFSRSIAKCVDLPVGSFYPEIGSVQNRARLDDVLSQYKPKGLSCAAYKIPLMEAHVFEAVENNVFGTYNLQKHH